MIETFLLRLVGLAFQRMFDVLELVHQLFYFVFVLPVSDLVFLKT